MIATLCEFQRNALLILALVTALLVCSEPPAGAQERVRFGISNVTLSLFPTVLAEKKGFYARYRLKSEHVLIPSAIGTQALTTGDLDYNISIAQGVSAALKGIPVRLVMMTVERLDFTLVVKPEVQKVADLRGKSIGISSYGSSNHLTAVSMLRQFGLEPGKDVHLLPSGNDQGRLTALESGKVDAVIGSTIFSVIAAKRGYRALLKARDYVDVPLNAVMVTQKKIEQSSEEVKSVIKGTIEALRFMRERKGEAVDIASQWLKVDRSTTRELYEQLLPAYSLDGTMTDKALRAAIEVELERAKIKKEVPVSQVADRTLLLEAQREIGLR